MRLESSEPTNESGFFACLSRKTGGAIYYERVEPADESGFPDIHFVLRDGGGEGTIELKYARTQEPNLRVLYRGTQKAAHLEYCEGGGRRRFALCYCNGNVYLWDTEDLRFSLRTDGKRWSWSCDIDDPKLCELLVDQLMDLNYE